MGTMNSKRAEELADKIISECMEMGTHWEPQSCNEIAPLMGRELAIHILQQALDAERDDAMEDDDLTIAYMVGYQKGKETIAAHNQPVEGMKSAHEWLKEGKFAYGSSTIEMAKFIDAIQQDALRVQAATIAELKSQLPEGMEECTIVFEECEVGHGHLRGTNWVKHECQCCKMAKLQERVKAADEVIRKALSVYKATIPATAKDE